jgi:hypothetical protein
MDKVKRHDYLLKLKDDLMQEVIKLAELDNRSLNYTINLIIENYFKEHQYGK